MQIVDVLKIIETIVELKKRNRIVPPCADELEVIRSSSLERRDVESEIKRLEGDGSIVVRHSVNRRTFYTGGSERWNEEYLKGVSDRLNKKIKRIRGL